MTLDFEEIRTTGNADTEFKRTCYHIKRLSSNRTNEPCGGVAGE